MSRTVTRLIPIAVVVVACARGGNSEKVDDPIAELVPVVARLAEVAEQNRGDCSKMAAELTKALDANKESLEVARKLKAARKNRSVKEAKELIEKRAGSLRRLTEKRIDLAAPMSSCVGDEKMKVVSETLKDYL
jgi:hypothetical protein